ncbi:hypothetical protein DZC78_08675 [Olleya aquimaris]|uniref:Lipoprotein n=1 Tax=Olleya sediminilitoris TaxID=2795739 RepID=A0ABS1WGJ1_9FLAO|nr:DUF6252 family protein [Olleya sediminilitoris]AXO80451.1 hypothetical protein DZC78_08675 [Olleya aquimaris]MBL7558173.1 hypothetical protein [Olleya sediminilitoris]
MKKITLLLVSIITLLSCNEDLVFNSPALIGYNDGVLWEASSFRANVEVNGNLTIIGVKGAQVVNLKAIQATEGTYQLGNTTSVATFDDGLGKVFTTNNIPDPSVQIYPSEGTIIVTEFNDIERTVSGTFTFHAFDSSGLDSENFNRGYFYNVPILNVNVVDSPTGETQACLNAIAVAATTETNFESNEDTASAEQYTQLCNAYKTSLEVKLQQCGDPDGSIQAQINGLGDCTN